MSQPSPLWTAPACADATHGTLQGDPSWHATGVSIDSRTVTKGDLFIALEGPNFDGHAYITQAFEKGAVAALMHKDVPDLAADTPLVMVTDTEAALNDLGHAARARTRAKIIAVTGSVGKTGVKEALAHCLSQQGKTHATQGNLNNHLGLPLTLARLDADADYAVLELGMNHAGELHDLSLMAKPDVALITTVAAAHLEHFPSVAAIADAKSEIFDGLPPHGIAIINADNPHYARMKDHASAYETLSFGTDHPADAHADHYELHTKGVSVEATIKGQPYRYFVAHNGQHWVNNSLCILAALDAIGAKVDQGAFDLASLAPLKGRGAVHEITFEGRPLRIIDECYNANDASMRAALAVLATQTSTRTIAVLGDILELGSDENTLHEALAEACAPIDLVFTCGPRMRHLYDALPETQRAFHGDTANDVIAPLIKTVTDGDVVMIKSSRGTRTDLILNALLTGRKM